jgi:hypothetical protein
MYSRLLHWRWAWVRVGHQVDILTHPVMQNLVESHGLAFGPVSPDINMNEVDPLFTS